MSGPRETDGEQNVPPDDAKPRVEAEVIKDLDVEDAEDDQIRGGACPNSRIP